MSVIDIEKLLADVSPEEPCGTDLSYDPEFLALEEATRGKAEKQVGDQIVPAEPPDWKDVRAKALELFKRTHDLQVTMHLILALTHTAGLPGMADGLELLHKLLERHWDSLHPRLDPDDNLDPTERILKISALSPAGDLAEQPYVKALREVPLCASPRAGKFSYRDILVSRGDPSVRLDPNTPPPEPAIIDAAFEDTSVETLRETGISADRCAAELEAIQQVLAQRVALADRPNLEGFERALRDVRKCLQEFLSRRGLATSVEGAAAAGQVAPGGVSAGGGAALSGDVRSTQDVLVAIEKICAYYERTEPSSPVPLLLRRAKRLVSKDFLGIIRDLTPEAMDKIQLIGGLDSESAQ